MKKIQVILASLIVIVLAGCTTNTASSGQPFEFVTVAPNATPTSTPFQPIPWTPTGSPLSQPTLDPASQVFSSAPATSTSIPTLDPNFLINTLAPQPTVFIDTSNSQVLNNGQDTVNFLLIGSDKRSGTSFRTDTMIVAILRPNDGQVSMISIPRDLWVSIPGWENQRINTAYQHGISVNYPGGGPGLLKDTIQYNLGIRIDHTAMVDFDGFRNIVDTLGGLNVPVSCPFTDWHIIDPNIDPELESNWMLYTVDPGIVHMDGDLALWYARSRQRSSDFDRGRRQQEVLRAIFSQALQTNTLSRIPELYGNFRDTIETNLGLGDILQLSLYAPKLTNADIRGYYIRPPYVSAWTTDAGAQVLLPNQELISQLLTQALSPSTTTVQHQAITMDVMNGTAIPGYETLASNRLNYAGYETHIIPSDRQDYAYSVLIDKSVAQDRSVSDSILNVLGMLPGSLIPAPDPNSTAQYLLILGNDYQPCFRPESLSQ